MKRFAFLILACMICVQFVACDLAEFLVGEESNRAEVEGITCVDNRICTFKISSSDPVDVSDYKLFVFLENKTNKTLMFSLIDVSVNGYMCDPFWASTLPAGKKALQDVYFSESDLSSLGIKNVSEIEFTLVVYYDDDLSANYLVEKVFVFKPGH